MSTVACSKEYTITVSGGPPPTNYWPLTSIVGNNPRTTPDVILGNSLILGGIDNSGGGNVWHPNDGTNLVVPGKITNALSFPSSNRHPPNFEIDVAECNALGILNSQSFTLRLWTQDNANLFFNFNALFSSTRTSINYNFTNNDIPFAGAGSDESILMNQLINPFNQTNMDITAQDPGTAGWHRIIFGWNATTHSLFGKVDNGTTLMKANTDGSYMAATQFLTLYCTGFTCQICEIALWIGIVLTEPQMLFDWNNGAGRSWPW